MKSVGIIGGLGPEITSELYLSIIDKLYDEGNNEIPRMVISSIAIDQATDDKINKGTLEEKDFDRLEGRLSREVELLDEAGLDLLAIPCNTLHTYSDRVEQIFQGKFLDIIKLSCKQLSETPEKVGILATGTTQNEALYQDQIKSLGHEPMVPSSEELSVISDLIYNITYSRPYEEEVETVNRMISRWQDEGCTSIFIACTDLAIVKEYFSEDIQFIDSFEVLLNETVRQLTDSFNNS